MEKCKLTEKEKLKVAMGMIMRVKRKEVRLNVGED